MAQIFKNQCGSVLSIPEAVLELEYHRPYLFGAALEVLCFIFLLLASSWKNPLILFQCYEVHLTYDNQVSRRRRQSAVVMIIQSVTQNQVESCRQRRN